MSLTLKTVQLSDDRLLSKAVFELSHSTPGRTGTTLGLSVAVKVGFGKTWVTMPDLEVILEEENVEAALDRLAGWMERAALAIRERGKPVAGFSNYPKE